MSSQYGQDNFVLEVLGEMQHGFFLDSGAADGVLSSNTLRLEKTYGWNGICVEPNDVLFAALIANRQCHCVNCCIYDREGSIDFVEQANLLGGILGEYHPALLNQAKKSFHLAEDGSGRPLTTPKLARTLRSILREHQAPPVIDYWSLDTEGSELTILKSFPFDEYSFRVLTVEHNHFPVREEIRAFLEGHGYRRIRALEIDDCYVKGGQVSQPSWRSSVWDRRHG